MFDAERIRAHGFGANALFEVWVAEENRQLLAHAVITKGFDVRRGLPIIVLCELYVVPGERRSGLARRMMSSIARRAMDFRRPRPHHHHRRRQCRGATLLRPPSAPTVSKRTCSR